MKSKAAVAISPWFPTFGATERCTRAAMPDQTQAVMTATNPTKRSPTTQVTMDSRLESKPPRLHDGFYPLLPTDQSASNSHHSLSILAPFLIFCFILFNIGRVMATRIADAGVPAGDTTYGVASCIFLAGQIQRMAYIFTCHTWQLWDDTHFACRHFPDQLITRFWGCDESK